MSFELPAPPVHVNLHVVSPLLIGGAPVSKEKMEKAESDLKEAKFKIKEQDAVIARLRADLASLESKSELLIEKKALEVELRMRKLVEEAYDKGFASCKSQFLALKELQSSL